MVHSKQVERHVLAGLLKFPDLFPEVSSFLSESDFNNDVHQTIFCIIRNSLSKSEKIDKIILAQKIKNLGITYKDDIDIFDYIENLSYVQVTKQGVIEGCEELVKLRVRREIYSLGTKIQNFAKKNGDKTLDQIIGEIDSIYSEGISVGNINQKPKDLFGGIDELLEQSAQNVKNEVGLTSPFPVYNQMFGGIRSGNGVYAIVSRPAHGKSTFLLNMAQGVATHNQNCKVLYLDTEMDTAVNQYRIASAITQVPMWYLETGNWIKNEKFKKQVKDKQDELKKYKNKVFHSQVANKPITEICSIIKRWYFSEVGRGNNAMIVYDYIKLTGEKISQNWAEYQAIGEKINRLNEVGIELQVPIWTAMQLNRSAEASVEDSSAIALSDRLQWFAAFIAIFRKKYPDEIDNDGPQFGTHKLIPLKQRFQGKDSAGHADLVQVPTKDNRYALKNNFINYNNTNFYIEERGTLKDIVDSKKAQYSAKDEEVESDELL